jgi:hypothetical protein
MILQFYLTVEASNTEIHDTDKHWTDKTLHRTNPGQTTPRTRHTPMYRQTLVRTKPCRGHNLDSKKGQTLVRQSLNRTNPWHWQDYPRQEKNLDNILLLHEVNLVRKEILNEH